MALTNEQLQSVRDAYVYIRRRTTNAVDGEEVKITNGLCQIIGRETGETERQVHAKYTKWLSENTTGGGEP